MSILYILAYVSIIACVACIAVKMIGYIKKPLHLRWELYPVAHEEKERVKYGGSYYENTDWWKQKQQTDTAGMMKGFLREALFLHATYVHNRKLWIFTYPFHLGLYLLLGALGLTVLCALFSQGALPEGEKHNFLFWLLAFIIGVCNFVGFAGVLFGALGLIFRRITDRGLRMYSMPEHFFNLALFAVFANLGLMMMLTSPCGTVLRGIDFIHGMLTFQAAELSALYVLYLLVCFVLFIWVPLAFMGHGPMKYFMWHDIRWGDEPTQDNPQTRTKMAENLKFPVSWKAPHVKGDGKVTWAEVVTANPTKQDKE